MLNRVFDAGTATGNMVIPTTKFWQCEKEWWNPVSTKCQFPICWNTF